jgi:hypothetical protein
MRHSALLAGAVSCLALLGGAEMARAARTPCPPGVFVLDPTGAAAAGAMLGLAAPTVEIDAGGTVRLAGCETTGRVKAKRKFTKIGARWVTCGTASKVRLAVKIAAPACQLASGSVKGKRAGKAKFTATRLGWITTTSVPGGSTTTTSTPGGTTTSTTIPIRCGNGVRDGADECEGVDGCGAGERCTASCTCAAVPPSPSTSQTLIADALRDGVIDYPTSLVYRAWALFADSQLPPEYDGEAWQSEDATLFVEITSTWNNLDPATQDLLRPFTLRPDEVGSYWDPGPPTGLVPRAPEDEDHDCPYQPGAALPDWRSTPTTNFVIWSCGGGDPNQDPDAAARTIVAGLAESVWSAMVPETGPPKADQYPPGSPADGRIDVYLVRPRLCKTRDGVCVAIPLDEEGVPALGAAAATTPCDANGTAAETASSFMLLDVTQVAARPPGGEWPLLHVFAHEFFHVMQNTWSFEGPGGRCNGDKAPQDDVRSWMVESWAEWAAGAYFPDAWPSERARLFRKYQGTRDGAYVSLRRYAPEPYDAFIYPLFVRQEKGSRADAVAVWKSSGGARTPEQLDQRANTDLPFQEHFRDFAVRNFNDATLPGDPQPLYQLVDAAIPPNVRPIIVEPAVVLDFPVEKLPLTTLMQPLSAEYRHFTVDEHIAFVRIDLAPLTNATFAQMDAMVKVGDRWERRRVPGTVFEFCREDPEDAIEEFYLILSNHGYVDGAEVSGRYDATALFDCPGGWTGSFELITTLDEYAQESLPGGYSYSLSEHSREEQRWTVSRSEQVLEPVPHDEIALSWHGTGHREYWRIDSGPGCSGARTDEVTLGSGSGHDRITATPAGNGVYGLSPIELNEDNAIRGTYAVTIGGCNQDYSASNPTTLAYDAIGLALGATPGLTLATPNEKGGKDYSGEHTILHSELERPGGMEVIEMKVRWDLHRR